MFSPEHADPESPEWFVLIVIGIGAPARIVAAREAVGVS